MATVRRFLARIAALEAAAPVDLAAYRKFFDHALGDGPALTPEELAGLKKWALLELLPIDDSSGAPAPVIEWPASLAYCIDD